MSNVYSLGRTSSELESNDTIYMNTQSQRGLWQSKCSAIGGDCFANKNHYANSCTSIPCNQVWKYGNLCNTFCGHYNLQILKFHEGSKTKACRTSLSKQLNHYIIFCLSFFVHLEILPSSLTNNGKIKVLTHLLKASRTQSFSLKLGKILLCSGSCHDPGGQ